MITLPAGPKKYLLLDSKTLARNVERSGQGGPAVIVAVMGGLPVLHIGYNARSSRDAEVYLTVFPRGHRFQKQHYAAWTTEGEVVLDDTPEGEGAVSADPITPPAYPVKPAKPATPKPMKVKS